MKTEHVFFASTPVNKGKSKRKTAMRIEKNPAHGHLVEISRKIEGAEFVKDNQQPTNLSHFLNRSHRQNLTNLSQRRIKILYINILQQSNKSKATIPQRYTDQEKNAIETEYVKQNSRSQEQFPYMSQTVSLYVVDIANMLLICRRDLTNMSQKPY